jgi:hypothetical protein
MKSVNKVLVASALIALTACKKDKAEEVTPLCNQAQIHDFNKVHEADFPSATSNNLELTDLLTDCMVFKAQIGDQSCKAQWEATKKSFTMSYGLEKLKCDSAMNQQQVNAKKVKACSENAIRLYQSLNTTIAPSPNMSVGSLLGLRATCASFKAAVLETYQAGDASFGCSLYDAQNRKTVTADGNNFDPLCDQAGEILDAALKSPDAYVVGAEKSMTMVSKYKYGPLAQMFDLGEIVVDGKIHDKNDHSGKAYCWVNAQYMSQPRVGEKIDVVATQNFEGLLSLKTEKFFIGCQKPDGDKSAWSLEQLQAVFGEVAEFTANQ